MSDLRYYLDDDLGRAIASEKETLTTTEAVIATTKLISDFVEQRMMAYKRDKTLVRKSLASLEAERLRRQ